MIAVARRERKTLQDYRHSVQTGFAGQAQIVIRRRSRVNPIFFISGFTGALLFDALSSAPAQSVMHRLWARLSANPVAAIAAALAFACAAGLIARFFSASFARSRGADRAARAKD
jgi:hypothetical protein